MLILFKEVLYVAKRVSKYIETQANLISEFLTCLIQMKFIEGLRS